MMFGQNAGAKRRVSFNMLFLAASSMLFQLSFISFPKRLKLCLLITCHIEGHHFQSASTNDAHIAQDSCLWEETSDILHKHWTCGSSWAWQGCCCKAFLNKLLVLKFIATSIVSNWLRLRGKIGHVRLKCRCTQSDSPWRRWHLTLCLGIIRVVVINVGLCQNRDSAFSTEQIDTCVTLITDLRQTTDTSSKFACRWIFKLLME